MDRRPFLKSFAGAGTVAAVDWGTVVARRSHFAWTKDLAGVTQGPLPFFWGVGKTV